MGKVYWPIDEQKTSNTPKKRRDSIIDCPIEEQIVEPFKRFAMY